MKKTLLFLASTLALLAGACTNGGSNGANNTADTTAKAEAIIAPPTIPESETFYDLDSANAIVVANPISYDVTTKCYIHDDDGWDEQRLANTNTVAIANVIFQAVYKGRLTPYDYFSEEPISIDSIKSIEKKFTRKQIGKIMFTEKWYFSETTLTFTKKVESVTLGYELIDKTDNALHGFKPAFIVKLNEAK